MKPSGAPMGGSTASASGCSSRQKPQAESWIKAEQQDTTCQQWWLELSNAERVDMMNAFARSRDDGFTLLSAVDHFAVEGRGKKFLKKMTLEQALGNTGRDRRRKSQAVVPKASGFLGDKVIAGTGHGHLAGLQCVLNNFVEFAGPTLECSAVSPELIKSWLTSGGALGKQWSRGPLAVSAPSNSSCSARTSIPRERRGTHHAWTLYGAQRSGRGWLPQRVGNIQRD